jgi:hypothetical protein
VPFSPSLWEGINYMKKKAFDEETPTYFLMYFIHGKNNTIFSSKGSV